MTEKLTEHRWLYLHREVQQFTFYTSWIDHEGNERTFGAKKDFGKLIPGSWYIVHETEDNSVIIAGPSGPVWDGMLLESEHELTRQACGAIDRAANQTVKTHRKHESLRKENTMAGMTLEELHEAYAKCDYTTQMGFEQAVIQTLRRGR